MLVMENGCLVPIFHVAFRNAMLNSKGNHAMPCKIPVQQTDMSEAAHKQRNINKIERIKFSEESWKMHTGRQNWMHK